MAADDEGELEKSGPSRRTVLRAGALGVAAWSVPTIRPIARTAMPGSKPPTNSTTRSGSDSSSTSTDSSTDQSSSALEGDTSQSTITGDETPTVPGYSPTQVDKLEVSDPAKPVDGNPNFTG